MASFKILVSFAFLFVCFLAVQAAETTKQNEQQSNVSDEHNRQKKFALPYFGGLGYSAYAGFPYNYGGAAYPLASVTRVASVAPIVSVAPVAPVAPFASYAAVAPVAHVAPVVPYARTVYSAAPVAAVSHYSSVSHVAGIHPFYY